MPKIDKNIKWNYNLKKIQDKTKTLFISAAEIYVNKHKSCRDEMKFILCYIGGQ